MAVLWTGTPPEVGSPLIHYAYEQQFPEAIRERRAAINNGDWRWPPGTGVFFTGLVSSIEIDPDDSTKLRVHCTNADESAITDWIVSGTKRWNNYTAPPEFPYRSPFYKVAIFPKPVCSDGESDPIPGDPNDGHTLHIDDHGTTYLRVPNDGVMVLNDGKTLGDYAGFVVNIHRASVTPEQAGYSWMLRYPPKPNDEAYAWGYNGLAFEVTVTDPEDFTLTVGGHETEVLEATASAAEVQYAIGELEDIGDSNVVVLGGAGGPFTVLLGIGVGDAAVDGTGADAVVLDNVIADITQSFPASLVGKEVCFQIAGEWKRVEIDESSGHMLTFASFGTKPDINDYFGVFDVGGYFRPQLYAGAGPHPRMRVDLEVRQMRLGPQLVWGPNNFWHPWTWYATLAKTWVKSHSPIDDNPAAYGVPAELQTVSECANELCDCDEYFPDGGKEDVQVFDTDLTTLIENFCTAFGDLMYSPLLYWSKRGWQLAIEGLVTYWVEPKSYVAEKKIPTFVLATWWKFHKVGNTRTATITSVSGGTATFADVGMPQITPLAGNYASLSDGVWYAVLNADKSISDMWTGTLTATTLTMDAHGTDDSVFEFDPADEGKTIVIAFGWTREYERRVHNLYDTTIASPDTDDEDQPIWPPTEENPGEYTTEPASTAYSEFDELGYAEDTGGAFVVAESARVMTDHWDVPTGREGFEELFYRGIPARTSDFPRFSLTGTFTEGGTGWGGDANNLFEISATPSVQHTGTGTTGSNANTIRDSALYKLWPTTIPDPPYSELQLRLSNYWTRQGGERFIGMTARIALSGDGSPGDPYVWSNWHRITDQDISDEEDPAIVVTPAFPSTALNRRYEIDEPGSGSFGSAPAARLTGVATAGSNASTVYHEDLVTAWPTLTGDPVTTARVAVSGDGTLLDPYVWSTWHRIVSQDATDPDNPSFTVSPAFPVTTLGRPYEIDRPAVGGVGNFGAYLNRMKGIPLLITHADGSTDEVKILVSRSRQLYWDEADAVSVAAGDTYVIDEVPAGAVVQYKPEAEGITHNGWVKPEAATQDTRGNNWHLAGKGIIENDPTTVTNYGRLRKWDIMGPHVYHEMYTGLNALKHMLGGHAWDDLDEENWRSVSSILSAWNDEGSPAVSYIDAVDNFSAGHSHFWSTVGATHNPPEPNSTSTCTSNIKVTGGSAPPQAEVEFSVNYQTGPSGSLFGNRAATYHYGKVTDGNPCIAHAIDFYAYGTRAALDPDEIDDTLPGGGFTKELFDPMGTGLVFRQLAKWHTIESGVGAERITTEPLGSLNAPEMPSAGPQPDEDGGAWSYFNSFYVKEWMTVRRFDVPGGLRYVA